MDIPLNIDILQILLHMLNFVILAGGLSFLLYKPVNRFLEQRREHFAQIEKENKEATEENERLRAEYEQKLKSAEEEILEQKKAAEKELANASAKYIGEAKERAASIILAAEREAEDRKEHILESAQTEIGELVVAATQKLLSDTVTPERNSALYDEFIRVAEDTVAESRKKHDRKSV
ncbi:MAG: ATP synthase F0 subunit B [Clostridia bacterium]|nr:ATP synthase F0 subunit B [Clostridia bacterium]